MALLDFPQAVMLPVHDHFAEGFDGYSHDPRCMGSCGPCGGEGGVPDTGPNGEMAVRCLYCWDGTCPGCNLYNSRSLFEE